MVFYHFLSYAGIQVRYGSGRDACVACLPAEYLPPMLCPHEGEARLWP